MGFLQRFWLLLLIIVLMVLFFVFGLNKTIGFDSLQKHYVLLQQWTAQYFLSAMVLFMAVYVLAVALSIPGAVFLTLLGGFLFGVYLGTLIVVCAATLGASILFLAVRVSLGEWLASNAGRWTDKMRKGFQENAFSYLLILRLIPLFPFWVINIVPALLKVPMKIYLLATVIGIIPGTFVYVSIGNGLAHLLEQGEKPNLGVMFTLPIIGPLIGLAALACLPILYRTCKGR